MSTRARCTNPKCSDPDEREVPEFGPPWKCRSCGRELESLVDQHAEYPPTRHLETPVWHSVDPPRPPKPPSPPKPAPIAGPSWSLAEGSIFAGRYRILRKIGQGGMGAVFEAHDDRFDRVVALKVPNLNRASKNMIERFYREARAMAQLIDNPNICKVMDVDNPAGGKPYMTMEFIRGKTLAELLKREGGKLPAAEAARIVAVLARALGYAHSKGIIHRDLKPDNVMIRDDETPILMDFGLVRRDSDERITVNNTVLGTLPYMSPEQASGDTEAMGPASDIYSLGVILYELLAGRRPFKGVNESVVILQILNDDPIPPSVHRPDLDAGLEAACLKAMAKDPERRHPSMAEFAEELIATLPRPKPKVDTPPIPETAPEPVPVVVSGPIGAARTGRWKAPAVVVGLLAVGVAGGLLYRGGGSGEVGPNPETLAGAGKGSTKKAPEPVGQIEPADPGTPTPPPPPPAPAAPPSIRSVSTGMRLVLVDRGRFEMGSTRGLDREKPPHGVEIRRPFFLGRLEVTQAEYEQVTGEKPSHFAGDGRLPVDSVSWLDAVRFCNKLSVKDGLPPFYEVRAEAVVVKDWSAPGYRLPTEAEWEYACRGGRPGEFGAGDDDSGLARHAWFRPNSKVDGLFRTHPEEPPNAPSHPFDLQNMQGNVYEWCWDWYRDSYEGAQAVDPTGPASGEARVVRGGAYNSDATLLRPAARHYEPPDSKLRGTGFRVARNDK